MVLACAVCLSLSWPVIAVYNFGPFIIPLSKEFGWSRGEISGAITVINGTATLIALILGVTVDRFGAKHVMLPSIILLALTVSSMYWLTDSLLHFYLVFFLIALFGAGTSTLATAKIVLNWFDHHRGLALGLSMAGVGVGATTLPYISTLIINSYGWREAYLCVGCLILLISGLTCSLAIREHPEDMGERKLEELRSTAPPPDTITGYTLREVLHTRAFWLLLIAFFLVGFCAIACTVHLVPMLQDRGVSAIRAAQTASLLGGAMILGRVLVGYLMDRFFAPHVAIMFMLGPAVGLAFLASGASGPVAYFSAIMIGLALGAEFDILAYFTSRYAGMRIFGTYYGMLLASFNLGSSIGPYAMGLGYDSSGAYSTFLWLFAGGFIVICILFSMLGPYPQLPRHPQGTGPA
ncbi:MAG: MFS transporter [Pseudomonadales bacterium]